MTDEATTLALHTERSSSLCFAQEVDAICKICLDDKLSAPLISPCKCSGTMKFIHEECLKTWILSKSEDITRSKCELCHFTFQMKLATQRTCRLKAKSRCTGGRMAHYAFFCAITLGGSFAVASLSQSLQSSGDTAESGVIVGLVVTCFIMFLVCVVLVTSLASDFNCLHNLRVWRILEYRPETPARLTIRQSSRVYSYDASAALQEARSPQAELYVVPRTTQARGLTVQTPQLRPGLSPVRSTGSGVQVFTAWIERRSLTHDDPSFG